MIILADDVIDMAGSPLDIKGFATGFAEDVQRAQRFVYSPDTAAALCRLAKSKPETLLAALPLCRAPFPTFWMEWPGGLGDFSEAPSAARREIPKTFGVLAQSLNPEGTTLGLMFAWSFGDGMTNLCPVACQLDLLAPTALTRTPADALAAKIQWGTSWCAQDFLKEARARAGAKAVDLVLSESMLDVQGEIPWVIAAICLLSVKNGIEKKPTDLESLNAARQRRGKRPFLSHSTVKIALTSAEEREARERGLTGAELRQHIVRGHFKVRPTGVYWWRPFVRGKAEAGQVIRSGYRIAKS